MRKRIKLGAVVVFLLGILFLFPTYVRAGEWQKYDGKWIYIEDDSQYTDGVYEINGKFYYFNDDGIMQTGWIGKKEDSWTTWYYAEKSGALAQGWKRIGSSWYWFDKECDCAMWSGGSARINGKLWVFQNSGALVSKAGWIKTYDGWYYTKSNGTPEIGWKKLGGKWYYFTPEWGLMVTGGRVIDGVLYTFDKSGVMVSSTKDKGWKKISGYWYYIDSNNKAVVGWQKIDGSWYYFDRPDGAMLSGYCLEINGKFYAFLSNGKLVSKAGWYEEKYSEYSNWYYTRSDGICLTKAWKQIGGKWYYFDDFGVMVTDDYYEINGKIYSFSSSGAMRTGWIKLYEDEWYYADPKNGAFKSGWVTIGGYKYYFDPYCYEMYADCWFEDNGHGYYVKPNGRMAANEWILDEDYSRWHYAKANGWLACDEWIDYENDRYWIDEVGERTEDAIITYQGDEYYLKPDGKLAKDEKFYYDGYQQYAGKDGKLSKG